MTTNCQVLRKAYNGVIVLQILFYNQFPNLQKYHIKIAANFLKYIVFCFLKHLQEQTIHFRHFMCFAIFVTKIFFKKVLSIIGYHITVIHNFFMLRGVHLKRPKEIFFSLSQGVCDKLLHCECK